MEIRCFTSAIVDKTAAFVARNGVDFENKIREKEAANPRFSFLSATDPYNAYYQHKVAEFRDGKAAEPTVPVIIALFQCFKEIILNFSSSFCKIGCKILTYEVLIMLEESEVLVNSQYFSEIDCLETSNTRSCQRTREAG